MYSADSQPTFRRNLSPPTSRWENKPETKVEAGGKYSPISFLLGLFFNLEDGGDMFLRNVVDFQRTTRRYISEDTRTLHNHRCDNLKSYNLFSVSKSTRNHTVMPSAIHHSQNPFESTYTCTCTTGALPVYSPLLRN
jgi:hypothetical protein